jgi:hypothetical protein
VMLLGNLDPEVFSFQSVFGVLTIVAMLGAVAAMDLFE